MPETRESKSKEMRELLKEYSKVKKIYDDYIRIKEGLGKPRTKLINLEEIKKNLREMGAISLKDKKEAH